MPAARSTLTLVVTNDRKVLSLAAADQAWTLPHDRMQPAETSLEATRRIGTETLGCELGATWMFDTIRLSDDDTLELYVSELASHDVSVACEHRWLDRDDLLALEWEGEMQRVIQRLGMYWDSIFMSEHW